MAHFAELDENNVVMRVIVVHNNELLDNGSEFSPLGQVENEQRGIDFCKSLYGSNTRWIQTSYNANFRKHYAGIGYTYDAGVDAFIPVQPYPSWILDENCVWQAPVAMPNDGQGYVWDESILNWRVQKMVIS